MTFKPSLLMTPSFTPLLYQGFGPPNCSSPRQLTMYLVRNKQLKRLHFYLTCEISKKTLLWESKALKIGVAQKFDSHSP